MFRAAHCASEAVRRLRLCDPTLKYINLPDKYYTDKMVAELVDCLLSYPNNVKDITLCNNKLTDETGVKLAHFVLISTTIRDLSLRENRIGEKTFLAIAAALRVNTSLQYLHLSDNRKVKQRCHIDAAFADALMLNSKISIHSSWMLYEVQESEFKRLKTRAEELGHPSLQATLALQLVSVF